MATTIPRQASYGMQNTTLETTTTIERIIITFGGIALFNMIELFVQIAFRFKRWKGLYFWSLIVATFGIMPYTLGLLFKFFGVIRGYPLVMLAITLIDIGWQMMVTGQSIVLYSRLHLICRQPKVQRAVLWMIIANWFISNVPTTVFVFGAASQNPAPYTGPYGVWERLQLCLYFVQEVIISCIYGFEVMKMLKPELFDKPDTNSSSGTTTTTSSFSKQLRSKENRKILRHLLWINVVIVCLDITLLAVEFIGHYEVQVLYKGFVYSVKLKMEFGILNQLTDIAQARLRSSQASFGDTNETPRHNWGSLASADTALPPGGSVRTTSASNWPPSRPIGVLPDLEKDEDDQFGDDSGDVAANRNEPLRPSDLPPQPLVQSGASRHSHESKRPSAVRSVSFVGEEKTNEEMV